MKFTSPIMSPRIVYCKDCRKHNKSPNEVEHLEDACPLVWYRGRAQGHEFDYQWCVYGKRKEISEFR